MLKLEPFPLQLPTLHSGNSPALCFTRTFNFQEVFKRTFKIYGIWPQASTYVRMQTYFRNAVPLVWGSLRLTTITLFRICVNACQALDRSICLTCIVQLSHFIAQVVGCGFPLVWHSLFRYMFLPLRLITTCAYSMADKYNLISL